MELKQEENFYPEFPEIYDENNAKNLRSNEFPDLEPDFDFGIEAYATPKWTWNSMKLPSGALLYTTVAYYNDLIELLRDLTYQLNSEISNVEMAVTSANTTARSANKRSINNAADINTLWDWQTSGRAKLNNLWSWSSMVDARDKGQDNMIANSATDISTLWDWQTSGRNRLNTLYSWSYGVDTNITNHRTWIDELWAWSKGVDTDMGAHRTWIDELWEWSNTVTSWQINAENNFTRYDSDLSAQKVWIDELWEWSDSVVKWQKGAENTMTTNYDALDVRLKKIEEFNIGDLIDLTAVIIAINSVGTKINSLSDLLASFKYKESDQYDVNSFAFYFKSQMKSQTDAIVRALTMVNDNFKNYFEDWKNGTFWFAFKQFSDFQMAVFLGVFFDTLREDWESNWLDILDVWNVTNGFLNTINGWLEMIEEGIQGVKDNTAIITQWLKQIYEKPIAIIPELILPDLKFDEKSMADAIKEGLKDLNLGKITIGDVVNEAGTNLWDVLKEGVKQAGEVFKAILDFITNIGDFIQDLIDKIIALIIPKDMNFISSGFSDLKIKFEVKFDSILSIAVGIKEMFKPIEKDFATELSFEFLGAKFEPDMTILDSFVPKFRGVAALLLWFHTSWWVFRRLTGTGDIVNDN